MIDGSINKRDPIKDVRTKQLAKKNRKNLVIKNSNLTKYVFFVDFFENKDKI